MQVRALWSINLSDLSLPTCQRPGCNQPTKVYASSGKAKKYCSKNCSHAVYIANRRERDPEYVEHHRKITRENNKARYHSDPEYRANVIETRLALHHATYVPKPKKLFVGSDGKNYYGHVGRRRKAWEAQIGVCALCHLDLAWIGSCLDHDHTCCPKIKNACGNCDRGVVHNHCNAVLGFARDDIKLLQQAIDYLEAA